MNKKKIFNDPVHGFLTIRYGLLFDLIEHRYFQRLRRITQLSLTHFVYPGALHTRFHHALGAMHLVDEALQVLISKKINVSKREHKAALIAILLHDIGHGPVSHTLEKVLLKVSHERLSLEYMKVLDLEYGGALRLAIKIFEGKYERRFFHQLISSQLDMDRMDYLSRDSFYTGVHEGVISYRRLIKMLNVVDSELVIEEKGVYSVEKFLLARRLMYWQVYLHKTVLVVEKMLIKTIERAKWLRQCGVKIGGSERLDYFLTNEVDGHLLQEDNINILERFALLDDHDVMYSLKDYMKSDDKILSFLASSIVNRRLFKIELMDEELTSDFIANRRHKVEWTKKYSDFDLSFLFFWGKESNESYSVQRDEIKILKKDKTLKPLSEISNTYVSFGVVNKYYLCYPKNITYLCTTNVLDSV